MIDSITVNNVTYEIERQTGPSGVSDIFTIEEFPGLTAELGMEEYIEEFMSPRDAANIGTMCVSYNRYNLGDEEIKDIEFEIECPKCEGAGETDHWIVGIHSTAERLAIGSYEDAQEFLDNLPDVESGKYYIEPLGCDRCHGEGQIPVNPVEYFKRERGARVVLPLSVYEHSGITMFVGHQDYFFDPGGWDTSYVGFIFDTPEGIKECMGDAATISDEEITEALEAEVKLYASYLEGDVTYYRVEDEETGYDESCGGYVGDSDYCESECIESLKHAIEKRLSEIKERADMAARDIITKE